jgi:hypothetical protein
MRHGLAARETRQAGCAKPDKVRAESDPGKPELIISPHVVVELSGRVVRCCTVQPTDVRPRIT